MSPLSGRCPVLIVTITLMTVFFSGSVRLAEAKRGCSAFGHSCFGGHGKRADLPSTVGSSEIPSMQQPSQEVLLSAAEDTRGTLPEQDVRNFDFTPQRYLAWSKVQPFLRQWLESYRRSAEGMETN